MLLKIILVSLFLFGIYIHPSLDDLIKDIEDDCVKTEKGGLFECEFKYIHISSLCYFTVSNCELKLLKILSETKRFGYPGYSTWFYIFKNNDIRKFNVLRNGKTFDPTIHNNLAIIQSARYGRVEMLKELLRDVRTDPSVKNNKPLREACLHGHLEIVKLLCFDVRVNCRSPNHLPLSISIVKKHHDIIEYFFSHNYMHFPKADFLLHYYTTNINEGLID